MRRVPDRPKLRVVKPGRGGAVVDQPTRGPVAEPPSDEPEPVQVEDIPREPGEVESGVLKYVASLKFAETDPRGLLGLICVRIAQRIDEIGAQPAAVKELRAFIAQLQEIPNEQPGFVDEARVRRAAAHLDVYLATL